MSLYSKDQQENIFIDKKGRELLRSKLITREQYNLMHSLSDTGLKQTGLFFRALYFIFSLVFLIAALGYFIWLFKIQGSSALSFVFFLFGIGAYLLAEWLIVQKRVYRYGIEEGFALGASILFLLGVSFGLASLNLKNQLPAIINSLAAAALYYWYYRRFGFLYAAFLAIYFLATLPFQFHLSEMPLRLTLLALFGAIFYLNIRADQNNRFEYQTENNQIIQAILVLGIYFALNAAVPGFSRQLPPLPPLFYWACFLLTFIVPGSVLFFGVRNKSRAFIDAGLITSIISLCTIKLFFSIQYQAWDPVVLGFILMVVVFGAKRLIDSDKRPGYTSLNILNPETYGIELLAAGVIAANPSLSHGGPFSGGTAGGAGASRHF